MSGIVNWSRRPGVRLGAVLAAVFVAGTVVGAALDRSLTRRVVGTFLLEQAGSPDQSRLVARMQRTLRLDDAQVAKVRAVLERRQPQMRATWTSARGALLAQLDTTMSELAEILTPEQRRELLSRLQARGRFPRIESLMKARGFD